jgi:hypothetical protein
MLAPCSEPRSPPAARPSALDQGYLKCAQSQRRHTDTLTSVCLSTLRQAMSFTELRTRNNAGEEVSFEAFAGKVVLAVNVARL